MPKSWVKKREGSYDARHKQQSDTKMEVFAVFETTYLGKNWHVVERVLHWDDAALASTGRSVR